MADNEKKLQWFVVQTSSGYENRVQKTLVEQISREDCTCSDRFGRDENGQLQIIVPTEQVSERKDNRVRVTQRKIFPGYVLVHMIMDDETWHLVKDTSHVQGFLGPSKDKPSPLSEAEASKILAQLESGENKPKPKTVYTVGDQIRVCDGPFKEYNGTIESVDYEKAVVTVAVTIFGRQTPVDLDFSQIEKP